MKAALADLTKAKAELASAMRNKGGHRGVAAKLVNQAIGETQAGIRFAAGKIIVQSRVGINHTWRRRWTL